MPVIDDPCHRMPALFKKQGQLLVNPCGSLLIMTWYVLRLGARGTGLQILRVAVNILNKQSWIAGKRWPFSLEVECGARNSLI
jgi:hypothetical protein